MKNYFLFFLLFATIVSCSKKLSDREKLVGRWIMESPEDNKTEVWRFYENGKIAVGLSDDRDDMIGYYELIEKNAMELNFQDGKGIMLCDYYFTDKNTLKLLFLDSEKIILKRQAISD